MLDYVCWAKEESVGISLLDLMKCEIKLDGLKTSVRLGCGRVVSMLARRSRET